MEAARKKENLSLPHLLTFSCWMMFEKKHRNWYLKSMIPLNINVSAMNVSPDAAVFPNPEEMAELQLDPFARMGINTEMQIPEAVLFEQDGIKVVCEKSLYNTSGPTLMFVFRVEELPDDAFLQVNLKEINGVSPDDKELIRMTISILQQVTDFTGINSVTFHWRAFISFTVLVT